MPSSNATAKQVVTGFGGERKLFYPGVRVSNRAASYIRLTAVEEWREGFLQMPVEIIALLH